MAGMILGTAAYMAPEQARGKPVDRRADIWAFGCVLYECLTGRCVVEGESLTDILAGIVEREPDWSKLPAGLPADVRRLLRRCLHKDPRVRLRDIGEARVVLAGEAAADDPAEAPVRAKARALPFVAGLVAASVAWLGFTFLRPSAVVGSEAAGKAFHMTVAWNRSFPGPISPDGNRLVFQKDGGLWIRDLAELEPRRIPGTDGKERFTSVEWSPDGDSIAILRESSLEVLRLGDTHPQRRIDLTRRAANFSWGDDGSFLLEIRGEPSYGVHLLLPGSSTPEHLDWLETEGRVLPDHAHPSFLPGSEQFLVTLGEEGGAWIHVASLKTRSTRKLVRASSRSIYVHPGWLAWVDEGRLLVQPFDPVTATVSGTPHELVGDVRNFASTGGAAFSFSREGSLHYLPWGGPSRIEWVDREGRPLGPAGKPRHYSSIRLDPTGRFLATSIVTPETYFQDLWIIDLERDTPQRLTHEDGWEDSPVWSPDGKQIAFAADWSGPPNLYVKPADGGQAREIVPFDLTVQFGGSWTPDGRSIVYVGGGDIWSVDVETLERRRLLETPFRERDTRLSPDGSWLAYASDESGRNEVYLASFPDLAGRRRVSSEGGDLPRWRADSAELFFRTGGRAIASVTIEEREGRAEPGRETIVIQKSEDLSDFDVTSDGSRFLLVRASEDSVRLVSHVITNWQRLVEE
jgi:Tol biopolymer transport system component